MPICPTCGFNNAITEMRCPECGGFYSKIVELIDQAASEEEAQTFAGRYRRIMASGHIKQALWVEWQNIIASLSLKAKFALFVIFVFVFALVASVL